MKSCTNVVMFCSCKAFRKNRSSSLRIAILTLPVLYGIDSADMQRFLFIEVI